MMTIDDLIARAEAAVDDAMIQEDDTYVAKAFCLMPDLIAALRAEREARARAEHHARAGWALATHWQTRYTDRAMAEDAALDRIRQEAADEALERAASAMDNAARIMQVSGNAIEVRTYQNAAKNIRALKGGAK